MGSSVASSEELAISDVSGGREDKIFVSIRLRPLSDNEIARHDLSDWECVDHNTLIFRNSLPERSIFPTCAHTFDRVFECDSSTRKVYEEGAKEVALSVVNGINASILAYGQTSSGKTYTMCGITAYAVSDLYDYIQQQSDREFVMKFSAMEIYNEAVTDLLSSDTAPLRLLDDPERGTVVERLIEDTLTDRNHFEQLLHICEAQRKIGETSLNETSSRSHQILRVTVESSARDYFCTENSNTLAATVNFVDLAGSERAFQTLSAGTRLKEGCHINRSLLTLGTVIRKLSRGRHAHVPYRDSRLTRILQNSLGGNARTAIICTMSPAHSHVEQSRNTLLFASCAKEVSTNAHVNVLTSDKALVKQLKKELAKMESHVRSLESTSTFSASAELLLREKELKIEKMDKEIKEVTQEIKEVTQQRDLAQGRVEELLRLVGEDKARQDEYSVSGESSVIKDRSFQVPEITDDNFLLDLSTPKFSGPDPCRGWEFIHQRIGEKCLDICKDVEWIEEPRLERTIETDVTLHSPDRKDTKYVIGEPLNDDKTSSPRKEDEECNLTREGIFCDTLKQEIVGMDEDTVASPRKEDNDEPFYDTVKRGHQDTDADGETSPDKEDKSSPRKEGMELNNTNVECDCVALQQKVHNMQKAIKRLVTLTILEPNLCSEANMSICGNIKLGRSMSCTRAVTTHSSSPLLAEIDKDAIAPPSSYEMEFLLTKSKQPGYQARSRVRKEKFCRQDSTKTVVSACLPVEHTKMLEEDVDDLYRGLRELAKSQSKSQHDDNMRVTNYEDVHEDVQEEDDHEDVKKEEDDDKNVKGEEEEDEGEFAEADTSLQQRDDWAMEFQRQRSQIIELWDACYVPLVHRSYFFLLFNGDPSDSIYMEVELRRLSFLVTSLNRNNPAKNSFTPTRASSMKALTREREMLSKQIHKKLERNERESLYRKWGINLNTKQRSLQMTNRIWTDTKEMVKVEESAALVAKLMQVMEPGQQVSKEMFGLSFSAGPTLDKRYSSWRSFSNLSEVQFQF